MPVPSDVEPVDVLLKGAAGVAAGTVFAELAGLGVDMNALAAKAGEVPIKRGKEVASICPYCAVGCGQIVMVDTASGKILDIQGNPDSPISQGTLCPKGAATYQLGVNPHRWTKVKYRAPLSDHWEEKPLDWAMERIAQLVKKTRDDNFNEFQEMPDGKGGTVRNRVMNTSPSRRSAERRWTTSGIYPPEAHARPRGRVVENQARI